MSSKCGIDITNTNTSITLTAAAKYLPTPNSTLVPITLCMLNCKNFAIVN